MLALSSCGSPFPAPGSPPRLRYVLLAAIGTLPFPEAGTRYHTWMREQAHPPSSRSRDDALSESRQCRPLVAPLDVVTPSTRSPVRSERHDESLLATPVRREPRMAS